MKARAVNVRTGEWDVYVGRGYEPGTGKRLDAARWGNPFPVAEHGPAGCMRRYFAYLERNPEKVELARTELAGKRLGCWCSPKACHGDVLAGLANGKTLEEIKSEWAWLLAENRGLFPKEAT